MSTDELHRLKSMYPAAVFVSALHGRGAAELLEIVASRLAMDTQLIRLSFDPDSNEHRRAIADLYRHARVVSHVANDDRVDIEAEIPRRLVERFVRVSA
ncbi:MAG: hypothetical protein EPO35_11810 [Acidobacteria bacterium]|nr:MAG: hypothetical protein EPO35_11810 [Acidobacteriota bacterium]